MWASIFSTLKEQGKYRVQILEDNKKISFQKFIDLLVNQMEFRTFYNKLLAECEFEAFFWEHPPVTFESLNQEYEFVLVDSKALARIKTNYKAFEEHFSKHTWVVDFDNLGKNARLVVPCPNQMLAYTHLANFTRIAPKMQIDAFWQRVAEKYQEMIAIKKRWLNTSGLGVHWLHVRIDTNPKYYTHREYSVL